MCSPIGAAIGLGALSLFGRSRQPQYTAQTGMLAPPLPRLPTPAATGMLDPEKLRGEDQTIKVGTTNKQKRDSKRARQGLKTLRAVDPASASLPSTPSQGVST